MANQDNPLVSISIPTYNRANQFLRGALECALKQTYKEIEIIVSNNCSTDDTEEVVKSYDDQRIRYYKQEKNIGPNNNFNFCLSKAEGKYYVMLLDDDRIDLDFVETCVNAARTQPDVGLVRTGTRLIDGNDKLILEKTNMASGLSPTEFFRAWFRNEFSLYVCSTLFNTQHLKEVDGFHSKHDLFQDVMTEARILVKHGRIDIPEVKASFRMHDENWGVGKVEAWTEDCLDLLEIICDLIPEDENILRSEGMRYFCKKNYSYASRLNSIPEKMKTYFEVYNTFDKVLSPYGYIYKNEIVLPYRSMKQRIKRLIGR